MHLISNLQKPCLALFLVSSLAGACSSSDDGGADVDSAGSGAGGTGATSGGGHGGTAKGGASNGGATKGGATNGGATKGGTDNGGTDNGGTDNGGTDNGGATVHGERVMLGAAEDFAVLAKSGISTVPTSAVTGDIGVSPAAASYVTGFSLIADATNRFATSPQVTGKIYAADYASPTPSDMTTAVSDMELAFTDAAGRAPDVTELGAGDIGGMTLTPGVYQWGTGLLIPVDLTLDGDAKDVWVFQIAQDLTLSSGASVTLSGGAHPENVFWQVSGHVELGTTAHLEGVVLSQTAISLGTGASVNGRLIAQTAVTLDGNAVVEPAE